MRASSSPAGACCPLDTSVCGAEALKTLPRFEQVFVNAPDDTDEAVFNRKLFMARRRAEKVLHDDPVFYVPSLSTITLVYKGMVMPQHLVEFYPDLGDERMTSSVAMFHQRFSTNTMPQWRLAHPFRFLAHNGEINTVEGNRSWAYARGPIMKSPLLPDLSDSAAAGHDARLRFAEPRQHARSAADGRPRHHACHAPADSAGLAVRRRHRPGPARVLRVQCQPHMEPWDGPAGVVLTDGRYAACTLDRNGLRPARWVITEEPPPHHRVRNRRLGLQSPRTSCSKGKLGPGEMVALDLTSGELLDTRRHRRPAQEPPSVQAVAEEGRALPGVRISSIRRWRPSRWIAKRSRLYQKMFNITAEEREEIIRVLAEDESEAVGSMGDDTPMPVLSHQIAHRCTTISASSSRR